MRVKNSLGQTHYNKGDKLELNRHAFIMLDHTREYYIFDVIPMGAVRMTQSDKWKTNPNHPDPRKRQRKAVMSYWAFKTALTLQANLLKFVLSDYLDAVYFIPMPDSWSEKKKKSLLSKPCLSKPDTDNITKAVKDTLLKEDSGVWWEKAEKRWAYKGSIVIYQ